jgi:beta-lactam-binding protein with PASTA domain
MASSPGPQPAQVTVPDLVGLPADTARDFAHRAQLVAVGPDPDAVLPFPTAGSVVRQEPLPGTLATRWSTVVIWTRRGGPGDAGVREPRRPNPPPLSVQAHADEPAPEPQPADEDNAALP